jgi:GNAT superfamily N-acetyltransferase
MSEAKRGGKISKPAALKAGHGVNGFDCGREELNRWLIDRAKRAGEADTARTFVVCRGKRVVGYYSLAAGAVEHAATSAKFRQNTPDPIPVIILARLGVHRDEKGQGIGQGLLADAMKRSLQAARHVGARALLVHALDASAVQFYKHLNFKQLQASDERTLHISMKEMRDALA